MVWKQTDHFLPFLNLDEEVILKSKSVEINRIRNYVYDFAEALSVCINRSFFFRIKKLKISIKKINFFRSNQKLLASIFQSILSYFQSSNNYWNKN